MDFPVYIVFVRLVFHMHVELSLVVYSNVCTTYNNYNIIIQESHVIILNNDYSHK